LELEDKRLLSFSKIGGELRLWTADGQLLDSLHIDQLEGMIKLQDGRLLSWSEDGTLGLWTAECQPLAVLRWHTERVQGALELQDKRLLSWSTDGTLRLWTADGRPLHVLEGHTNWVGGAL
jgi:WD40 repeat protein